MTTTFEALADPTRRRILALLQERPRLVGELVTLLELSQPLISKHLRVLREVGLVNVRQDAQRRWYELNPGPLAELDDWLAPYRQHWAERFDRLDSLLDRLQQEERDMTKLKVNAEPGSHAVEMTREFDAPRELVFRAYIDPVLVPQWWGPPEGVTTIVDKMDARKGGMWRYVQRTTDGIEYSFHGVYHEVVAPERIVHTFEFEGMPGHVLLETITFEDRNGRTLVTDASVFQSVADRDGMIQSGMEGGAQASWDRFEALLKTLKGER